MKKRIFSMFLVVVMLVTSLAGCAYRYEKDDMSKYTTFNTDAFKAALKALTIEDETNFTANEETRKAHTTDAIINSLAGLVSSTGSKVKDKVIGANDLLYYCYFVTGTITEKNEAGEVVSTKDFVGAASSMKESAAVKLQLGLSTNKDLAEKIQAAIKDWDFKGNAYSTDSSTSTTVKAGDKVYVTYTKASTDAEGKVTEVEYKCDVIVAAEPTGETVGEGDKATKKPTSFAEYITGMKLGTAVNDAVKFTEDGVEYTYSKVTPNWTVSAGTEIAVNDYKPESKIEVDVVGSTNKVDLASDKVSNLVYHVYPVYFIDVVEVDSEGYTATLIIEELLGTAFNAGAVEVKDSEGKVTTEAADGTLDILTDNGYKNPTTNKLMNAIAKELDELFDKESEAKEKSDDADSDYTTAKSTYEKNKTPENESAMKTAETAKTNANKEYTDAQKKVDEKIAELLACTKSGETKTIEEVIREDYFEYRYESLEGSYESAITKKLAQAIYDAAAANIKFNSLPKKAVKEAYERLMDNFEYDFYEGKVSNSGSSSSTSTSTSTMTNYEYYGADLYKFLRKQTAIKERGITDTSTKADVDAAIKAIAEEDVKHTMTVYVLLAECNKIFSTDLTVTKADVEEFKNGINYLILMYYSGASDISESDYMPALQFDKVMNYLTEIDEDATHESDKRPMYKNITYSFKAAE